MYPPIEGRQANGALSPSIVETVAGFTAGIVSTLAVHPFDVVKTRLQIQPAVRNSAGHAVKGSTWRMLKQIGEEARVDGQKHGHSTRYMRAFYRGLMPNMVGNSVSWGVYFLWYANCKELLRNTHGGDLRSSDYFLASGISGILTSIITNPIWVIKTRMLSTSRDAPGAYRTTWQGASEIFRHEGIRGFYRGLVPSLLGVSHGAIQFMIYEKLKVQRSKNRSGGIDSLTNIEYLWLSAVSKMFAGSVTYPYQVIRARLQTYDAKDRYKGALDVINQVWKSEGAVGFFRG